MGGIQSGRGSESAVKGDPSQWEVSKDLSPKHSTCLPDVLALTLDTEGKIASISKSFETVLNIKVKDVIGQSLFDLIHLDDIKAMRKLFDAIVDGSESSGEKKIRMVVNGGDPVQVLLSVAQLSNGDTFSGISAMACLVENGEQKEVSSIISYEITEQLLSWTQFLAIATDLQHRIIMFSPSAEQLTGFNKEDVLGKEITHLLDAGKNSTTDYMEAMKKVLEGEAVNSSLHFLNKNGSAIETKWRSQPIRDQTGNLIGVMGFGHEFTASIPMDEEVENLGHNFEVLAETSTDIAESEDLAEAIDKDLGKLIDSLGVDFAIFRLIGAEAKPRMVCAGMDFKKGRKLLESRVVGLGPLYRSVQSGKAFITLDAQTDPRIVVGEADIKSIVCLPIKFKSDVYGCAAFGSTKSTTSLQSKLPILQVFCNQVAISVRKALLKGQLLSKNKELEILYETSMAVSSTLEMQKVLSTILAKATELVQADNVYLFQTDKNNGVLRLISSICHYPTVMQGLTLKIGEGVTGLVAQTGKGMLIERADKDVRSKHVDGTPDEPSSLISVPLKMGDELLGVVTLERVPGTPFNENDYRLIELFSFQASTAIHNAFMFNRMNEHASTQQMYNILLTHDVANYNVPIHGYLEMLAKDPKLDERQRRFIKSALAQSENISSLISDVRKLSMLRSLEAVQEFSPVSLVKVAKECIESLRMNTLYEEIEIKFAPPEGDAIVEGDELVKDVVYNLLSNACKYGGAGPIEVEVHEHDEDGNSFWRMDVKDRGEGVSEERKAFMFRRFDNFDVESASEGHGIGLSVVRALSERFGGRVWVEDREKMDQIQGSIFSVTFPRVKV